MHFTFLSLALCVITATHSATARPTTSLLSFGSTSSVSRTAYPVKIRRRSIARVNVEQAEQVSCATPPAEEKNNEAGAGGEAAEGEEEAVGNEVEIESAFDVAVPVEGGDLKQDLVFTPSTVGKFEFEFQSLTADEVTVSENTAPAPPPAGFEAIEPNSYKVSLAQSKGAGLTLSKIDYIFDPASAGLAGKDVTGAQVGKLCTETGAFIISETLGELEFELEENEVTLNLNKNVTAEGEWGIFLPVAAAAVGEEVAQEKVVAKEAAAKEVAKVAHAMESEVVVELMSKGHARTK